MPSRKLVVDGVTWEVLPSGHVTQYDSDEFGLAFVSGTGAARELRITRYRPSQTRSREQSLAELSDASLRELFETSQSSERSPEGGYAT
jgi:hypothetical protein